jgi:hypothetical protein
MDTRSLDAALDREFGRKIVENEAARTLVI